MYWIIGLVAVYLGISFFLNMSGFKWYHRIFLHIFWLPLTILLWIVFKKGDFKIM